MPKPRKGHLLITVALALAGCAAFATAQPGPTACLLVGLSGFSEVSNRTLADRDLTSDSQRLLQITSDARNRIETVFGKLESRSTLVFLGSSSRVGPFKLNAFGSTQFIGSHVCVMVGLKGQNVDVVAHELMHAELSQRVGYLKYLTEIPTWFDEGLAMQVDYRARYALSAQVAQSSNQVRKLTTDGSFFVADDNALKFNYASAKHEVATWLSEVGTATLYSRLARMKAGELFAEITAP